MSNKIIDTPFLSSFTLSSFGVYGVINHLPMIVLILTAISLIATIGWTLYKWSSNWKGFRPWKK